MYWSIISTAANVLPKPSVLLWLPVIGFSWNSLYTREQYPSVTSVCIVTVPPLGIAYLFRTFLANILKQIDNFLVQFICSSEISGRCLPAVLCMHGFLEKKISYGGGGEYFNEIIISNDLESPDFCDSKWHCSSKCFSNKYLNIMLRSVPLIF